MGQIILSVRALLRYILFCMKILFLIASLVSHLLNNLPKLIKAITSFFVLMSMAAWSNFLIQSSNMGKEFLIESISQN